MRRLLMGFTVIIFLIPVASVAFPETINQVVTGLIGDSRTQHALAAPNNDSDRLHVDESQAPHQISQRAHESTQTTEASSTQPNEHIQIEQAQRAAPTSAAVETKANPSTTDTGPEATHTSPSSKDSNQTSTSDTRSTTSSPPPSTSPSTSPQSMGGTITGPACPCTVTGSATLKGDVSLQGDLVVDGGTLIARSGVNLSGNGHRIMFMRGGKADIQGTPVFTWSDRGTRVNLKRDINFVNLTSIMFMDGAGPSTLRYLRISDSGGPNIHEYPLHWHLNGNSTSGTLVEGVVVVNGQHHAFVPHGSNGITFKDTIAKNTKGNPYWWNSGDATNRTLYDHALADGVTNAPGDNRGFQLSGFFLGRGNGNRVRDSVARDVASSHGGQCSGYHWPENNIGEWGFANNAAFNVKCDNGIFVWQNAIGNHVIDGFVSDGVVNHGAYLNNYVYNDLQVAGVKIHALGTTFDGGHLGAVKSTNHNVESDRPITFQNLTMDSFTIDNDKGSAKPATYILKSTNLTCSDIQYQSVVPGTKVIVDGKECR